MLIKTVSTVVATDSVGRPVDAIPVREAVAGETSITGKPVTPIPVTEDPRGTPVRFVTGKSAVNSAGVLVDSLAVTSGAVQPVLNTLTVSPSSATVGQAYTGTVSGKTTGSVLSLTGAGSAGLSVSGTSITGTPTSPGAVNVVETLAGATGSPKTSPGVVTVGAAGAVWILATGAWNDAGKWDDTASWKDS